MAQHFIIRMDLERLDRHRALLLVRQLVDEFSLSCPEVYSPRQDQQSGLDPFPRVDAGRRLKVTDVRQSHYLPSLVPYLPSVAPGGVIHLKESIAYDRSQLIDDALPPAASLPPAQEPAESAEDATTWFQRIMGVS